MAFWRGRENQWLPYKDLVDHFREVWRLDEDSVEKGLRRQINLHLLPEGFIERRVVNTEGRPLEFRPASIFSFTNSEITSALATLLVNPNYPFSTWTVSAVDMFLDRLPNDSLKERAKAANRLRHIYQILCGARKSLISDEDEDQDKADEEVAAFLLETRGLVERQGAKMEITDEGVVFLAKIFGRLQAEGVQIGVLFKKKEKALKKGAKIKEKNRKNIT